MEIISSIKKDISGNVVDRHQIHSRGDEYRDQKKAAALKIKTENTESVTTEYAASLAGIDLILQSETDQAIIDDLTVQKTTLLEKHTAALNTINSAYDSACQAADDEYTANRLSALQPGFEVIPQAEFDRIGTEVNLKKWDSVTQSIIDKPTAEAERKTALVAKRTSDKGTIDQNTALILGRGYDFKDANGNIIAYLSLSLEAQHNLHAQVSFYLALQTPFPQDGIKISQREGRPSYVCPNVATLAQIAQLVFPYVAGILQAGVDQKNYLKEADQNNNYVRTFAELQNYVDPRV